MQLFVGVLLGVLVSLAAWKAGSLSNSGAVAAAVTGGLIFGLGGWPWAVLLLTFFISSSALSRMFRRRKAALSEKFSKGSRRDWGQVLANDGLGTALVLLYAFYPQYAALWWFAYAGAMATVNADTWATELGVLNPRPPRRITDGQAVEPGTSGAISLYGMLATFGGALLIGLAGAAFTPGADRWLLLAGATLGGVGGSLVDSLLGATVQAIYRCPRCEKETERHPRHTCGAETVPLRGWRWLNNDWVNTLASLAGSLVAAIFI